MAGGKDKIVVQGVRRFLREMSDLEKEDKLDHLLGRIAIEKGYITHAELEECVSEQKRMMEKEQTPLRIGQILVKRRLITAEQLQKILQKRKKNLEESEDRNKNSGDPDSKPESNGLLSTTRHRSALRLAKFDELHEVGRGGMGIVYVALDRELKRKIALKVLRDSDGGREAVARLHREASVAAQLSHPNIIGIYEVGTVRDEQGEPIHYIAMEYVEGETLASVIKDNSLHENMERLYEVSVAVAYAHQEGIIHRDLKPGNILLNRDGRAMVSDFGLARSMTDANSLTITGSILGTPYYMAPEQVGGKREEIGPHTDVWALGVILYQMLARKRPFRGKTPAEVYEKIWHHDPDAPRKLVKTIPQDLEVICLKALEKDPMRRYPSAKEFARDLQQWREGNPIDARPASTLYRLNKRLRRNPWAFGGTAAAIFLSVTWLAYGLWNSHQSEERLGRQLRKANDAFAEHEYKKATHLYNGILSEWPEHQEAKQGLSLANNELDFIRTEEAAHTRRIKEERNRRDKAKSLLASAEIPLNEASTYLYHAKMDFRSLLDRVKRAQILLDQALALTEEDPWLHYHQGRAWEIQGDFERAEESWRSSLKLDPNLGVAHYRLGRRLLLNAYVQTLTDSREKTISTDAATLATQGLEHIEKALEREGGFNDDLEHTSAQAMVAYAREDIMEARRLSEAGIKQFGTRPGSEEFYWLKGILSDDVYVKGESLNRALEIRPKFFLALFSRAVFRFQKGDQDGALEDYSTALVLQPRSKKMINLRAGIYTIQKRYQEALEDYTRYVDYWPDDPLGYGFRSAIYGMQKRWDKALLDLTKMIELDPKEGSYYMARAGAYLQYGDTELAREDYEKAVDLMPPTSKIRSIALRQLEALQKAKNPE